MNKCISITLLFLFFCGHSVSSELDVSGKSWKSFNFPNRYPQTIILSKKLTPVYFETGENIDQLNHFEKSGTKSTIDSDDVKTINSMINSKYFDLARSQFLKSNDLV